MKERYVLKFKFHENVLNKISYKKNYIKNLNDANLIFSCKLFLTFVLNYNFFQSQRKSLIIERLKNNRCYNIKHI